MIKEWIQKITDIVMPLDPLPEEEPVKKVEAQPAESKVAEVREVRRAATGGGGSTYVNGIRYTAYTDTSKSARQTLSQVKAPEFDMKIYRPADYNQVAGITDDVLSQCAVVVNYEHVNLEEQQRICDFIDGACYAIDGTATQISERIYLYAPPGIDANDIAELIAPAATRRR